MTGDRVSIAVAQELGRVLVENIRLRVEVEELRRLATERAVELQTLREKGTPEQ